ncbi:MAG: hypothetical protein PF904_05640 [Kiritimatiellae bacterium]|jgi:hypothetical protein|nr:hypothetical protein [Kiritimatiellia bacterium]
MKHNKIIVYTWILFLSFFVFIKQSRAAFAAAFELSIGTAKELAGFRRAGES